jgi:hypothetical protein
MLSEHEARSIAERAVDRLGGADALDALFREAHEPYPVQEMIVDDFRVLVRLRHRSGPASVNVGPYTFDLQNRQLVLANKRSDD